MTALKTSIESFSRLLDVSTNNLFNYVFTKNILVKVAMIVRPTVATVADLAIPFDHRCAK